MRIIRKKNSTTGIRHIRQRPAGSFVDSAYVSTRRGARAPRKGTCVAATFNGEDHAARYARKMGSRMSSGSYNTTITSQNTKNNDSNIDKRRRYELRKNGRKGISPMVGRRGCPRKVYPFWSFLG